MKKIPRLITNESREYEKCLYVCDDNGNNLMKNNIVNYETMYFREDVFF